MKPLRPRIILTIACLIASMGVSGQWQEELQLLKSFAPADKVAYLESTAPERLMEMAYMNRYAYYMGDTGGEKDLSTLDDALDVEPLYEGVPPVSEALISSGNLDLFAYPFQFSEAAYHYYRIGSSDKILVILPRSLALKQMHEKLKELNAE